MQSAGKSAGIEVSSATGKNALPQDEEPDDECRDNEHRTESAKKKLPKWSQARVVDQVGEVNTLVATYLPKLFAALPDANVNTVEARLEKLQNLFENGKINQQELAAARTAALIKL